MTIKKLMIIVTPEMELLLNRVKKEIFYNSSQSDMIRTLMEEGWNTFLDEKQHKRPSNPNIKINVDN